MIRNKQNKKSISVIIPTYNSENTIKRAINSIFIQSIRNYIEIIIIDDNSSDNTIKVVEEIKLKKNFGLKLISNKNNMGAGYCREIGIKISTGFYITFLDSDDIWLSNKLYDQIKYMEKNQDAKFVIGDYIREIKFKNRYYYFYINTPKLVTINNNYYINNIPNSSVILLSEIAKKVKYPNIRVRNDFIYWNKILSSDKKIKAYNSCPGRAYYIYGSQPGISDKRSKVLVNQWITYRKYFKYTFIKSFYGVLINILFHYKRKLLINIFILNKILNTFRTKSL